MVTPHRAQYPPGHPRAIAAAARAGHPSSGLLDSWHLLQLRTWPCGRRLGVRALTYQFLEQRSIVHHRLAEILRGSRSLIARQRDGMSRPVVLRDLRMIDGDVGLPLPEL